MSGRAAAKAEKAHAELYLEKFPPLPDGVYIGLDEERYHADTALGSGNIRDVMKGANGYWYKSWMNPRRRPDKKTPSKILGSATHKLLLEGEEAFRFLYVRGPYNSDSDLTPAEKSALTKKAKEWLLEGQELLTADDYDFVVGCKDVIDADPQLRGCLDGGLAEVSVFWTEGDVRLKCRFDKLKLRGIGDVKTIANERERELETACKLDIHTYRYDVQAAHYLRGRQVLPQLVAEEKIFYSTEPAFGILDKIEDDASRETAGIPVNFLREVARQREYAFQFVFIPKTGAPDAWSCVLSPGNPIVTMGATDVSTAIAAYRRNLEQYGRSNRWLPNRDVCELAIEEMPAGFGRK